MKLVVIVGFLGLTGIAGCTTTRPPQELVDARAAYARAYEGPAAKANVAGLHEARRALDDAEKKFGDDPGSEEARHLAYVAHRRVLVAGANARAAVAAAERTRAEQSLASMKAQADVRDRDRQKAHTAPSP